MTSEPGTPRDQYPGVVTDLADDLSLLRDLDRRLLVYKFGIEELMTKLRILSEEFDSVHRHDPIEHITNRVKKPEGILDKLRRKGLPLDVDSIGEVLDDIAGVPGFGRRTAEVVHAALAEGATVKNEGSHGRD